MFHRITLAPSAVLGVTSVLLFAGPAVGSDCSNPGWTSTCHASTDGSQVTVGGTVGSGGSNASTGGGAPPNTGVSPDPGSQATAPQDCGPADVLCRGGGFGVVSLPDVTASDLASFAPSKPTFEAEPGGVGIVGMPTNFVASASTQTLTGTLFDRPVTVRFSPSAYVFSYGDGSSARSSSGGAAWAALGQPQFSATPTSHAYGSRGVYTASVSVEYVAAVDFGTGWRPVIGVVTATGGGQSVEIFEARTALVDKTCAENPSGPGC